MWVERIVFTTAINEPVISIGKIVERCFLRGILHYISALLAYAALTVVMTWPLAAGVADTIHGYGDPLEQSWILAWDSHALLTHPLSLFDANIFYPLHKSLAFSDSEVGIAVLVAPINWVTGNAILAQNLAVLGTFILCALGAYILTFELTQSCPGAFLAGVVFAFAPFRFAHIDHLNLLSAEWMPFSVLFLNRALRGGRRRDFVLFVICFIFEALSSFYYFFFWGSIIGVYVILFVVIHRKTVDRSRLANLMLSILVIGLIVAPFALPYQAVQQQYGFSRSLVEAESLSAFFQDYLVSVPSSLVYGGATVGLSSGQQWPLEHTLFPGVVAFILAVASCISLHRGSGICSHLPASVNDMNVPRSLIQLEISLTINQLFFAIILIFAFVMSLGPYLHFNGRATGLPLPYLLLYDYIPGFQSMRAAVRYDVVVMLALAVLSGYGLAKLVNLLQGRLRLLVSSILVCTALAEYAALPLQVVPIQTGGEVPPVYAWLSSEDQSDAIVELPADNLEENYRYQYFSTYHWHNIVNGWGSFVPDYNTEIISTLSSFPSNESISLLRGIGVRYVVIHSSLLSPSIWQSIRDSVGNYPEVRLDRSFQSDYVYEITGGRFATVADARFEPTLPDKVMLGRPFEVYIRVANPTDVPMVFPPGSTIPASLSWTGSPTTQRSSITLPPLLAPGESWTAPITVMAPMSGIKSNLVIQIGGSSSESVTKSIALAQDMPTSVFPNNLGASVNGLVVPDHVRAGQSFSVDASVRNTGTAVWLSQSDDVTGWVGLGIRDWRDATGSVVLDGNRQPLSGRAMLHAPVWPGEQVSLKITAVAPSQPGRYILVVDLVSERVTWFGDQKLGTNRVIAVDVK